MKNMFQRIFSVLLALVVMMSTVSFAVDKHFCGNFLVDMAILSEAETCEISRSEYSDFVVTDVNSNGCFCCSNQQTTIEGQDKLVTSIKSFEFNKLVFLSTFTYSYFSLFRNAPEHVVPFKNYSPPLVIRNSQLLDQVFLI